MMTQIWCGRQIYWSTMRESEKTFFQKRRQHLIIFTNRIKKRQVPKKTRRNCDKKKHDHDFFTSERPILSLPSDVTFNHTDKGIAAGWEDAIKAAKIACHQVVESLSQNAHDARMRKREREASRMRNCNVSCIFALCEQAARAAPVCNITIKQIIADGWKSTLVSRYLQCVLTARAWNELTLVKKMW